MLLLALIQSLSAAEPVPPVNADPRTRVAVEGTDVVAYFTQSDAVAGSPGLTVEHAGAVWQFSTAAHRDAFAADPERYAPQFGGYCSWAVGHGYTAEIDPEPWRIVDGRLYLNYSPRIQRRWVANMDSLIAAAERGWPHLLAGTRP